MNSFDKLTEGLIINNIKAEPVITDNPFTGPPPVINKGIKPKEEIIESPPKDGFLFDVHKFQTELRKKVINKNKEYHLNSENISGYDIASGCSRSVFYRINNVPTQNWANRWLPVEFRSALGTATHNFIQDNYTGFTETEVTLKVPSKRVSARLDALINNNILVEIKSCAYKDFSDIIKKQKPRIKDFYQACLYKYLLENHLDEIKLQQPSRGGKLPVCDNYKIDHFQFIYVAQQLINGDTESMDEAVAFATNLGKLSNSKKDPFWFIRTLTLDLSTVNMSLYEDLIKDKMAHILHFLNSNIVPPIDSKFIDKQACFFCCAPLKIN